MLTIRSTVQTALAASALALIGFALPPRPTGCTAQVSARVLL